MHFTLGTEHARRAHFTPKKKRFSILDWKWNVQYQSKVKVKMKINMKMKMKVKISMMVMKKANLVMKFI